MGDVDDQEELFSLYAELADMPQSTSVNDLIAGISWIRAAEKFQHPATLAAYRTYLRLLVQYTATLPSLPQNLRSSRILHRCLIARCRCVFRLPP